MAQNRDEKGRFLPGITPEGAKPFNEGTAKEMQRRSAEARKDNRIVADALRRALLRPDKTTGNPTIDGIVERVVERLNQGGGTGDLRTMADVLGELEQKVSVEGDMNFTFKFGDE